MIDVERLILNGTRFNYGTGILFGFFYKFFFSYMASIKVQDMIDVNQLKLTGTSFTYGTELLHIFNKAKKEVAAVWRFQKKKNSAPVESLKKNRITGISFAMQQCGTFPHCTWFGIQPVSCGPLIRRIASPPGPTAHCPVPGSGSGSGSGAAVGSPLRGSSGTAGSAAVARVPLVVPASLAAATAAATAAVSSVMVVVGVAAIASPASVATTVAASAAVAAAVAATTPVSSYLRPLPAPAG
jgi:hypothetical protein